jgi:hypothetical protein
MTRERQDLLYLSLKSSTNKFSQKYYAGEVTGSTNGLSHMRSNLGPSVVSLDFSFQKISAKLCGPTEFDDLVC